MRKTLKNTAEVMHFWANQVQSEGKAGNVFFDGPYVFSYGRHFCIARILPTGVVAFTTRSYSSSTACHMNNAEAASTHRRKVYCHDPLDPAITNMKRAEEAIAQALKDADRPRIMQKTRDAFRIKALHLAEQANLYLAALPLSERMECIAFPLDRLEDVRQAMERSEAAHALKIEKERAERLERAKTRLAEWKAGHDTSNHGFFELPVALRLGYQEGYKTEPGYQIIETSHGANIPTSFAPRLWTAIQAVRKIGKPLENLNTSCGLYRLNTIHPDGSIEVGCHSIPYSELEGIAKQLGYLDEKDPA